MMALLTRSVLCGGYAFVYCQSFLCVQYGTVVQAVTVLVPARHSFWGFFVGENYGSVTSHSFLAHSLIVQ